MEDEAHGRIAAGPAGHADHRAGGERRPRERAEALLRATTVAYGIVELVRRARDRGGAAPSPSRLPAEQCRFENFAVRVGAGSRRCQRARRGVVGAAMLSPRLEAEIAEPSFLRDEFTDGGGDRMGRYLEVEFPPSDPGGDGPPAPAAVSQSEEDARCRALGALFYELFSHLPWRGQESFDGVLSRGPPRKRACMLHPTAIAAQTAAGSLTALTLYQYNLPLMDLGFPSSICTLVRNLLECGEDDRRDDAYDSLETVSKDLHLLLLDPNRFLFDHEPAPGTNGGAQLMFRRHKLYGREHEVSLITDAFCRVSDGRSEAFFIGGFSGSGKSRLVDSLTARVDASEGYVLTHKFDSMSKKRPMLEVVSAFDALCLLIREKRSQSELLAIARELAGCFGADFPVLARLLPNVRAISPQLNLMDRARGRGHGQMNLRSVCFVLQRFMKVVSSKAHPVMLFLDDLQWCDDSALAIIEGLLCDGIRCSHLFFVGSYRSNGVRDDHGVFRLIESLGLSGVPTMRLSLEGLTPKDLNAMVSDALCMFPRITEPLSDIVFQKTKGNPFFVLEFLRSLVDRALLEYSVQKRRWIWDEDCVSSMDVTGNVLHLLSTKMVGLSGNTQLALKVASCFGIKVKESVAGYLIANSEYSNIQSGLAHIVEEGFMVKIGTCFYFAHDKIREAAYGLIPDDEKNQYHFSLGMAIHSATKGSDMDDVIFSLVDQVNHGIDGSLIHGPELRLVFAELNEMAGVKAVECADYAAAGSYLNTALSLLPTDHWTTPTHYDQSRRLCLLLAKSAYSSGDMDKAQGILQEILNQAHCLMDKLDAYYLTCLILYDSGAVDQAYKTIHGVLLQLGESIPSEFSLEEAETMTETTARTLSGFSEESLMGMADTEKKSQYLLQFYISISVAALLYKSNMVPFFSCRLVQLTKDRGICKYSLMGLVHFASVGCGHNTVSVVKESTRIGKLALAVFKKRFDSPMDMVSKLYLTYYGYVASFSEPVQMCADNLYRGFECGIACGDTSSGFLNAIHCIRIALAAGVHLPTLREKIDYFQGVMKSHGNMLAVAHLLLLRDTVSTLLGNGCNQHTEESDNTSKFPASLYHKAFRAFWIGHAERAHHLFERFAEGTSDDSWGRRHSSFYILFYGLNALQLIKRIRSRKLRAAPRDALKALKIAADCFQWNYRNKAQLMEAEIFSFEGKSKEAEKYYAASFESARCSGFIHEQGLCFERAGFHYEKIGDRKSAKNVFGQAKQCYAVWGSQMKVDKMTCQLARLQISEA